MRDVEHYIEVMRDINASLEKTARTMLVNTVVETLVFVASATLIVLLLTEIVRLPR